MKDQRSILHVIIKRQGREYSPIKNKPNEWLAFNKYKTLIGVDTVDPSMTIISIFYLKKEKDGKGREGAAQIGRKVSILISIGCVYL